MQVAPGGPYSVAVLDFDTGGKRFSYRGSSTDAETVIPAILTTELASSPRFTVVEREQLEAVLREQNLGASGAVTAETAASLGEVLGVNYLIVGKITELTIEEGKSSNTSIFGMGGSSKSPSKAHVSIELKVLDTESARIVAVASCRRTLEIGKGSSSVTVLGIHTSDRDENGKEKGLTDTFYAIAQDLAAQLNTVTFKSLPPKIKYKGLVALIDSDHYYINMGREQGIKKKMVFKVYREKIKAGVTIKVNLGELQVVTVDEASSECKLLEQVSPIKAGDLIESKF